MRVQGQEPVRGREGGMVSGVEERAMVEGRTMKALIDIESLECECESESVSACNVVFGMCRSANSPRS